MKKSNFNFTANDMSKWAEFGWIEMDITNTKYALENLFSLQDENVKKVKSNLDERVREEEKANSKLSEQDLETYISHLFDIEKTVAYEINRAQQFSQVLIMFSIFESKLKLVCDTIQKDFGESLEDQKSILEYFKNVKFTKRFPYFKMKSKKSNSDILKYRNYLVLFLDDKFKDVEKVFNSIYKQYQVRNVIAHQNGIADIKKYKQLKDIKTISFCPFKESYNLSIPDNNFISELMTLIKKIFLKLLEVLKLKTNEKLIRNNS
jgi:hypothetical protein